MTQWHRFRSVIDRIEQTLARHSPGSRADPSLVTIVADVFQITLKLQPVRWQSDKA
jgi:hypothetical protein